MISSKNRKLNSLLDQSPCMSIKTFSSYETIFCCFLISLSILRIFKPSFCKPPIFLRNEGYVKGITEVKNINKLMNAILLIIMPNTPEINWEKKYSATKPSNEAIGPPAKKISLCLFVDGGNSSGFETQHLPEKAMVR